MKLKRLILAGVSVVLLIACFVCYSAGAKPIFAGQGSGTNKKVETVEELIPVLEFLIDSDDTELLFAGDDTQLASVLSSSRKKQKYESATLTISSSMNASSSSGGNSASQRLNKEMTVYITEDGTLYDSAGSFMIAQTRQNSDGELESNNTSMIFDMLILQIGSKVYVNFKEFSYVTKDESFQIKHEYTNQWIKMPLDYIESIIMDVDMLNRSVLGEMGMLLNYLIEEDEVDEDETLIKLDEYDLRDAAEDLSLSILSQLSSSELKMIFDLSASDAPNILYSFYQYDSGNTVSGDSYSISQKVTEQIMIQNINNTEISFDEDMADTTIRKQKDFEKLFKHNQ